MANGEHVALLKQGVDAWNAWRQANPDKSSQSDREAAMITGRGGMGSHKHGISGYAPRTPRYKFTHALEANKALAARKRRPELTATTIKEALRDSKRGRP